MSTNLFLRRFSPTIRSINFLSTRLSSSTSESTTIDPQYKKKIEEFIQANKIAIFIKGEPTAPRCGFSNAVLQILNLHGCDFRSKNILDDEQLRQTMKIYSNWPTFPQVYFNGEFVGGCDILLGMHQSGELVDELKKIGIQSKLSDVNKPNASPAN